MPDTTFGPKGWTPERLGSLEGKTYLITGANAGAGFQAARSDVPVQIVTRDQNADFDPEGSDIVISFGADGLPGFDSRPILRERLLPVCAPGYLPGDSGVDVAALADHRLLHMSSADHADDCFIPAHQQRRLRFPLEPLDRLVRRSGDRDASLVH